MRLWMGLMGLCVLMGCRSTRRLPVSIKTCSEYFVIQITGQLEKEEEVVEPNTKTVYLWREGRRYYGQFKGRGKRVELYGDPFYYMRHNLDSLQPEQTTYTLLSHGNVLYYSIHYRDNANNRRFSMDHINALNYNRYKNQRFYHLLFLLNQQLIAIGYVN